MNAAAGAAPRFVPFQHPAPPVHRISGSVDRAFTSAT
jgi:hypothetical protein